MFKCFVAGAVLAFLVSSAAAFEVIDGKVVLSPEEAKNLHKCAEQGGCHIVSRAMLENYVEAVMQNAFDQAVTERAVQVCKNRI